MPEKVDPRAVSALSVQDKLKRYLLNTEHPLGKQKAAWFRQALGFTQQSLMALAEQIVFDESTAVRTETNQYGVKYNQAITILGANGRKIEVVFIWIRTREDGVARLVTARPAKKP